ncbi:MAG TPA: Spy/CpxP family protein refolding chaperone [Alphaproteobacteria bacterium]|nr:Spy/CpxP family protein refolding chaperone [Alphaproteobacteria bacterium]
MNKLTRLGARAMMAAALLGAIAFAGPTHAATGDHAMILAQTTPPPPATQPAPPATQAPAAAPAAAGRAGPVAHVETRIKDLHRRLHITPAQEAAWSSVAQVMRDNAKTMESLAHERYENAAKMTAVDDLRSYSALADAHADGLKKFVPVFQQLYDSMSDAQKKSADALFRNRIGRAERKAAPKAQ